MKLTVSQYQSLYETIQKETEEAEIMAQCVSIVTGKTLSQVDDMALTEVKAIYGQVVETMHAITKNHRPRSILKANGRYYQPRYKVATITAGQHTELQFWLSDKDWIRNMDKILASICVPLSRYGWIYLPKRNKPTHEQMACDLQEADFEEAYGCVLFFCKVFTTSVSSFLPSLEKELRSQGKTEEEIRTIQTVFNRSLDGYTQLSE